MKKRILFIIFIEIILLNINMIAYAGSLDFAREEAAGNYEPVIIPDTPPGDSGPSYVPDDPTPVITEPQEPKANISVPVSVEGMVFEDIERVETENDGSMSGTKHLTNNYRYDTGEPTVEGVIVSAGGDNLVTSSDGKYSYSQAGTHNISFTYGKKIQEDNYTLNRNTFKYNGQDYNIVITGNGTSGYDKSYLRKIKEIQKSYTEIYIVIDFSTSMRAFNENGKSRIEIVRQSAINFVNKLFEKSEGNVAVGFIAFAYEGVVVKRPTDIKADIIHGIANFDVSAGVGMYSGSMAFNFTSLNHKVGSNIGGAILKARDSFLSNQSNKVIVLFSDGAATAHDGAETLYADDTDDEIKNKLNIVAQLTKEDLKAIVNSDITLISILNKTEDLEKEYVEKSFKDNGSWIGNYYEVNYLNEEAVRNALLNDTKTIIENTESEQINYSDEKTFNGDDDASRRRAVNNYYDKFYYEKLKLFEVFDKLNGTKANDVTAVADYLKYDNNYSERKKVRLYNDFISDSNSGVEEFINNTWMKSVGNSVTLYQINKNSSGKVSSISNGSSAIYEFTYYTNDEGIECCTITDNNGSGLGGDYKASNVTVTGTTITLNAALIRRDEFKLELEKLITGVKLTLSDGTVLYNMVSSNASETVLKNKEFKEIYAKQLQKQAGLIDTIDTRVKKLDIEEVTNIPECLYLTVDASILQGATIEIEYTLVIKNNSKNSTFSQEIALVDYFDNGLEYRADNKLMTEAGINADYNWKVWKKDEMENSNYFSQRVKKYGNNQCIYAEYSQNEYNEKENIPSDGNIANYDTNSKYVNPIIGNNGQRYVKVVLSKVLSPEILDDFCYKNQAEIIKYKNNNSRRINWVAVNGVHASVRYPISGNYVPTGFLDYLPDAFTNVNEIDTAVSYPTRLVPPTGLGHANLIDNLVDKEIINPYNKFVNFIKRIKNGY